MERKRKLKRFIVNKLCEKGLSKATAELEKVETFLVENCASRNTNIIKDHLGKVSKKIKNKWLD